MNLIDVSNVTLMRRLYMARVRYLRKPLSYLDIIRVHFPRSVKL